MSERRLWCLTFVPDFYGPLGGFAGSTSNYPSQHSYLRYLVHHRGFSINYQTLAVDELAQLQERAEFIHMATYPDAGSIAVIDGLLVVKF